ncbi:uncharacterized protein N0V96_007594 [Colletotrichum fioriniae]|uniref:uncharacterized protein n=1 Tax=Colletotrichum fioriniae TaxID=710243 RepID=UPI0032DB5BCC|nr:hypothetical protein N0V96_007594 [Colletotrichum fioriniae]
MSAPPPPPPHGEAPKTTAGSPPPGSGLGPGNYDIFVIPQRDKGGGFIYLPSLAPNGPSFAAGFACALVMVVMFQSMAPAFKAWWFTYQGMGNMGMALLVIAVGVGAWAWGKSQNQGASTNNSSSGYRPGPGGYGSGANFNNSYANAGPPPPPPPHGNQYSGPPPNSPPPNHGAGNGGPRSQWQERPQPPPPQESEAEPEPEPEPRKPDPPPPPKPKPDPPKANTWEKAREETKKREQERKAKEEEERRKAETARKLREFREREARERARREQEDRERREKLEQEIREKEDLKQKLEKERQEREKLQREKEKAEEEAKAAREREAKEAKERELKANKEKEDKAREEARKKEAAEAAARKARVEAQLEAFRKAKREREEAEKAKKDREEAEKAKKLAEEEAARKAKEEAARKAKEAEEAEKARKGSSYAYSSGEKTSMWPNGRPPAPPPRRLPRRRDLPVRIVRSPRPPPSASSMPPPRPAPSAASSSNTARQPPRPSARTVDEDQYSYRPYDKPRHRPASSVGSESSWAPSATTTRTTPPPSMRGPYTTKDPDKIVIRAVYLFMNQFAKTPASQLVSGFGTVTDGLILRITTEGLFIDDDVRGVPQREWDVKAWTLKLVEVWCPPHCLNSNAASAPAMNSANHPSGLFQKMANQRARTADRGATKMLTGDEADAYLTEMLRACKSCCRLGLCDTKFKDTNIASSSGQTGEWKTKSLHVLRATVRDQEGKRYMFVLDEEEAWKVAVGVQRLRKGTQVRSLGVSGMSASDARNTLETLGWS